MHTVKWILFALLFGWITGCTTMPASQAPQNEYQSWGTRVQTLSSIEDWNLQALIAMRAANTRDSATLEWQQNKQNYTLQLFGPLGTNAYKLTGEPSKVTLQNPQGKTFQAETPELLVTEQTGWHLPVSNLYYWIRGLPVPHIPAKQQLDAYSHLILLQQDGWDIQFLGYTATPRGDLPSKIFLNSSMLNVKIIISQWQF